MSGSLGRDGEGVAEGEFSLVSEHGSSGPPFPLVIAGATAVGKSQLALALAQHLKGEIISVDSMQVYRGLDIGTDKPSQEVLAEVGHHLVDILELDESFDAAQFVKRADVAISEIRARDRFPILCGGTGLYFKAWLCGLGEAPGACPALRSRLEKIPLVELLGEIEEKDPVLFRTLDRENPRRVIRAVEVIRLTGKPFSAVQAEWARAGRKRKALCIGLKRPAVEMSARIEQRVDRMMEAGLLEETEGLLKRGLAKNPTAMQAIGYRQVIEYFKGVRDRSETVALIKQKTRQLARRQGTWFRRQLELEWFEWNEGGVEALGERVARRVQECAVADKLTNN